jgi:hypothetical protein
VILFSVHLLFLLLPLSLVSPLLCIFVKEFSYIPLIINLRDYYPFYTSDCFMEVSDEVAEMFKEFDRKEAAYRLRTYRHKAYYSLDRDDGLEHEAVFVALQFVCLQEFDTSWRAYLL